MTRALIVAHDGVLAEEVHLARAVLERLPGVRVAIAGPRRGPLAAAGGAVVADVAHAEVLLADVVVVPGMLGVAAVAADAPFVEWLGGMVARAQWTVALSVGGIAVAATGRADGEVATSWLARPLLERFGGVPAAGRVATAGRVLSASGTVSAFEVLGELATRLAGAEVADAVLAEVRAAATAGRSAQRTTGRRLGGWWSGGRWLGGRGLGGWRRGRARPTT